MNNHTSLHTPARPSACGTGKIRRLKLTVTALASLLFASCATMDGGGGSTRSLMHVYQGDREMTFITLFDMHGRAKGSVRTIGRVDSRKEVTLSHVEFESLWEGFEESKLARYARVNRADKFNTKDNYVISKGWMPDGATTYVIPKSEDPESVRKWVKSFRAKTGG